MIHNAPARLVTTSNQAPSCRYLEVFADEEGDGEDVAVEVFAAVDAADSVFGVFIAEVHELVESLSADVHFIAKDGDFEASS